MESRRRDVPMQEPVRGPTFALSAGATVVIGIALAGSALYWLRPRPPRERVVQAPPEIRIVERRVEVPAPPVKTSPPAPPPAPPPKAQIVSVGIFDGVWRLRGRLMPMFQLKHSGDSLSGAYSPANWSGVYPFKDGKVMGDVVEFAVADPLQRVHFRMTLLDNGDAKVEGWIAPEDALKMIAIANKPGVIRTPQQALAARLAMEEELKRLGRLTTIGVFRRVPDPGAMP